MRCHIITPFGFCLCFIVFNESVYFWMCSYTYIKSTKRAMGLLNIYIAYYVFYIIMKYAIRLQIIRVVRMHLRIRAYSLPFDYFWLYKYWVAYLPWRWISLLKIKFIVRPKSCTTADMLRIIKVFNHFWLAYGMIQMSWILKARPF